MGVARSRPPAALPALSKLLSHSNRIVRLQVGPAFAAYGPAARPYLDELVRAAAIESETGVRGTLDAAIAAIRPSSK